MGHRGYDTEGMTQRVGHRGWVTEGRTQRETRRRGTLTDLSWLWVSGWSEGRGGDWCVGRGGGARLAIDHLSSHSKTAHFLLLGFVLVLPVLLLVP